MASNYENFFNSTSFAVIGNTKKSDFPKLTYKGLKKFKKKVFPIDPSVDQIEGDKTYKKIADLPEKVDRVVLELSPDETNDYFNQAIDAGIKDVWIHMDCETPEVVALAKEKNINLRTGTCAVMYVTPGFTYHSIHKWIMKLIKKY